MATKKQVETDEQKRNREIVEGIANNISNLAKAVSALLNGPLKRQALIILLAQSSGLAQQKVKDVLVAMENLGKDWLK